ncbi:MAG TPA: putative PEP-binding protein, partial [Anaeromyxobacteraceae bacterium]
GVAAEGVDVQPEVMIPLVGTKKELVHQARVVRAAAAAVFAERGRKVKYTVGTMIEVPRGALCADEIAEEAEFFSFGTNDLTQTTFGISRDDVKTVLQTYLANDIYQVDPFVTIDRAGVGELMRIAVERGRRTKPHLKLGICGEHGGDPASVEFCHQLGLDYVSCSPYRLPIARLAAAQAALREAAAVKREKPRPASPGPARRAGKRARLASRPAALAGGQPVRRKKGRLARAQARG